MTRARRDARERIATYAAYSTALVGLSVALGWIFLDGPGRLGVLLAGAVAWVVQISTFVALQTVTPGTAHFLGVWVGSTVIRFSIIGGGAFAIAGLESIDLIVTLLSLAGLFLALMFLELWVMLDGLPNG